VKLPAHVLFRKDLSLIHWKPRGILDESTVNEIVAFIEAVENRNSKPLTDSRMSRHSMRLISILSLYFTLRLAGVSRPRAGPQ
jgi:hypothetical protein